MIDTVGLGRLLLAAAFVLALLLTLAGLNELLTVAPRGYMALGL